MSLHEDLYDFYLLHQQVRGIRKRLDAASRRHEVQRRKLDQLNQQLSELTMQHKQVQARTSTAEDEVEAREARIKQLREQMQSVTNNKEYQALLVEVDALKNEKGKQEEHALTLMNESEELAKRIAEQREQVSEQEKLVAGAEKDVAHAEEEIREQLADLTARHDQAAAKLPDDLLPVFERLSDAHDGEALAPVVEESRRNREYTCGGCYMTIPVERVNTLMVRQDEIVSCPSCNRILYMDRQLKESMIKS